MKIYRDIEPQIEVHPDEEGNPYEQLVDEIVRYFILDEKLTGGMFQFSRAGMPSEYNEVLSIDWEPEEMSVDDIEIPKYDLIRIMMSYERK